MICTIKRRSGSAVGKSRLTEGGGGGGAKKGSRSWMAERRHPAAVPVHKKDAAVGSIAEVTGRFLDARERVRFFRENTTKQQCRQQRTKPVKCNFVASFRTRSAGPTKKHSRCQECSCKNLYALLSVCYIAIKHMTKCFSNSNL